MVAYVRAHRAHLGVPLYTLSLGAGTQVLKALGSDARPGRSAPPRPHRCAPPYGIRA